MGSGAGEGGANGASQGVKPGALTALLREVAAAPGPRKAEPPPLLAGAVIGRFEILCELGRGAFGVVYEARDRDLGRRVALKVVRPGAAAVEDGKVSSEAEAIARLAHPNLVTLHDVGRSDAGPYLVFELLRGKTLQERIDGGPLTVQEAVHVAVEVARGLAHAHAEGVVHRDLKPANVFVTTKGLVKVLDFGMAHAFGRKRVSGGTPAYMAPEQWAEDPEDERTDVFALGVMLHVMLSGEYPFPEGVGRWSAGPTAAPKLDVPGAPGLADLVDRMLEKAPRGRPRDGATVLAALMPIEDALRAKPAEGSPPAHATRRKATLGDLVAELKRRRVFRVMVGYGIFAFVALQVSEPIMHDALLPEWVLTAVLVTLAVGFPAAVILAWAFDLTAQGVRRTPSGTAPGAVSFPRSRLAMLLAAVALLAAVPVAAWYLWKQSLERGRAAAAPSATPSIAVLPFADMSPGRDQEYFGDGIAEEILNALAHVKGLHVVGRTSSFSFKGKTDNIRTIGRELGAASVLEGSVRKDGGRIRITALLVKTADGYHLWSETYDRELTDVFKIQDEIARAVVAKLSPFLVGRPDAAPATRPTTPPAAYEEYLLGRHLVRSFSAKGYSRAAEAFERALAIDSAYAPAWAGLANALVEPPVREAGADYARMRERARFAAERSVALDPGMVHGYLARARLKRFAWDWQGARADVERAFSIDADAPGVHAQYAWHLFLTGDSLRARDHFRKATELDPLSAWAWTGLGRARLAQGETELARRALRRALEIAPEHEAAIFELGALEFSAGNLEDARLMWRRSSDEGTRALGEVVVEHALGHDAASRAVLAEMVRKHGSSEPYVFAMMHAARGERDLAFKWLERAYAAHDESLGGLAIDILLRPIHGDPRWKGFLRKMNLPVD